MDDVITLSSDSDEDESDVEIIGSYSNITTKPDPQPLTAVRVYVDAVDVKVPTRFIDLTDPRWSLPELKIKKRRFSTSVSMIDLTESNTEHGIDQETERFPSDDCPIKEDKNQTSNKQYFNFDRRSSGDPPFSVPQQNCGKLKEDQSCIDLQTHHQKQTDKAHHQAPIVKLRRLPFLETYKAELNTSRCSVYLNKDCTQMSLQPRQLDSNSEKIDCIGNLGTTVASNGLPMELVQEGSAPQVIESLVRKEEQVKGKGFTSTQLKAKISLNLKSPADFACSVKQSSVAISKKHFTYKDEWDGFSSSMPICSLISPSSSQDGAQGPFQRGVLKQLELDQVNSEENCLSDQLSPLSRTTELNHSESSDLDSKSHTIAISHNSMCEVDPAPTYEGTQARTESEWQFEEVNGDEAPNSPELMRCNITGGSRLSVSEIKDMDDASGPGTCRGDLEIDDPVYLFWQDWSYEEQVNEESRSDTDFRAASQEDRDFVCPFALKKIMSGQPQALIYGEDEGFGTAEVLCRHSLRLVYSTIDENYTEGTLQLLSDLLQPGYYPPRDITFHLLHGILLDPQCPYHLCVQAFNLLMRTQRHHLVDKNTVPWDWELLTSVMANQEHKNRYRCEVVRMLLEYIVQTLEDDFHSKRSSSALHHSIAKATLSCDQQFPRVRDVLKWLFSAIMKSTEHRESTEAARERDEQIRMVSIFQRMLSLALEVDRSPALHSAKLSQELFHMLIGSTLLRAHRMLLLESLQSKLLRCKLLEHLLDYACPVKSTLPMSLSLLLHLMKNCTLAPDPTDGTERWQKWEELVHLLWMLLLSYNKAMKGYLCSSFAEQQGRLGTYKRDDMVSKSAVCEAVEAFLSRSQTDLGQAVPLHVEESLGYLQDHLLDVCQC